MSKWDNLEETRLEIAYAIGEDVDCVVEHLRSR